MNITTVQRIVMGAAAIGASFAAAQTSAQPTRRPGLWDMQIDAMGQVIHSQMCVGVEKPGDTSAFRAMGPGAGRGMAHGDCGAGPQISTTPGGMSFHMVCHPSPQMTIDSTGTVIGDFRTAYTVRSVTRMTPSPQGMAPMQSTVSARFLGQCPAGMAPGDRSVNGFTMHRPG